MQGCVLAKGWAPGNSQVSAGYDRQHAQDGAPGQAKRRGEWQCTISWCDGEQRERYLTHNRRYWLFGFAPHERDRDRPLVWAGALVIHRSLHRGLRRLWQD
jgi:hypothetical protein